MDLTPRQQKILCAIVREYTKTAEPVSSGVLVTNHNFPWSSATVRSEMAALESAGFIHQPHTSSGRVPTDKGFRYYVNLLEQTNGGNSIDKEVRYLERTIHEEEDFKRALKKAVWTLSELTNSLALGSLPDETYYHGVSRIMSEPEYAHQNTSSTLGTLLDETERIFESLPRKNFAIFLGSELPIGNDVPCAMVVGRFRSPYSEVTPIAVVGSMRIAYEKVIPLVRHTSRLMEDLYYGEER